MGGNSDLSSSFSGVAILICCVSGACGHKSQISVQLPVPLILWLSCMCLAQEFKWYLFTELRDSLSLSLSSLVFSPTSLAWWNPYFWYFLPERVYLRFYLLVQPSLLIPLQLVSYCTRKIKMGNSSLCKSLTRVLILLHHLPAFESPQVAEIDMYTYMCCYVCMYLSIFISIYI